MNPNVERIAMETMHPSCEMWKTPRGNFCIQTDGEFSEELEAFARLIAEDCAKVVQNGDYKIPYETFVPNLYGLEIHTPKQACLSLADAIRERYK